jgi:flagellar hook-basal body complex protein FliE
MLKPIELDLDESSSSTQPPVPRPHPALLSPPLNFFPPFDTKNDDDDLPLDPDCAPNPFVPVATDYPRHPLANIALNHTSIPKKGNSALRKKRVFNHASNLGKGTTQPPGSHSVDPRRRELLGLSPYTNRTNPYLFAHNKKHNNNAPTTSGTDIHKVQRKEEDGLHRPQEYSTQPLKQAIEKVRNIQFNPSEVKKQLLQNKPSTVNVIYQTGTKAVTLSHIRMGCLLLTSKT